MKVKELLRELISETEPDLSEYRIKAKIDNWLNKPNSHFETRTPNEMIKKGRERRVILLLEQLIY